MLTARGWALAIGAALTYTAGRALGSVELAVVAAGSGAAIVASWFVARRHRPRLSVRRRVEPLRVHAGAPARVDLEISNHSRHSSSHVELSDAFDGGTRSARFVGPPLRPGEAGRAAYRLPSTHRGVFEIGPVTVESGDPLGLFRHVRTAEVRSLFTVYPRIHDVLPMPIAAGRERSGSITVRSRASVGEDFRTLREYVVGDDLRRVHWPTSARTEDLMIREHEAPWDSKDAVLLDTRADMLAGAVFEAAVEAAASLVIAGSRARRTPHLVFSSEAAHTASDGVDTALERLAGIQAGPTDRFALALNDLEARSGGGAMTVLTGAIPDAELARLLRLAGQFGFVAIIRFGPPLGNDADAPPPPVAFARPRKGVILTDIPCDSPFAAMWTPLVQHWRPRAMVVRS